MREKGFAPIFLLIVVLIVGVIGAMYYSGKINLNQNNVKQESTAPTIQPSPPKEIAKYNNGSTQICGDIPDKAFPEYVRLEMRTGPKWSPDCKHIAWAMWQSGTGCPDCPKATLSDREGVFLYSAADKTVTGIYKPKKVNETPEFIGWIDNDNLLFKANQQELEYNLTTNKVLSQSQTIDTSNWKTYTNTTYSFSFTYPQDWIIGESKDSTNGYLNLYLRPQSLIVGDSEYGVFHLIIKKSNLSMSEFANTLCGTASDRCDNSNKTTDVKVGSLVAKRISSIGGALPVDVTVFKNGDYIFQFNMILDSTGKTSQQNLLIREQILSAFKFTN